MADEPEFECVPLDAHLPSGTLRFYVPRDFPLAGGVFGIRRLRTCTDADQELYVRPEPPTDYLDEREAVVSWLRFEAPAELLGPARELADLIEANAHKGYSE